MYPKRGAFAVFLTVIALVALLSYKTPAPAPLADNGSVVDAPSAQPSLIALAPTEAPASPADVAVGGPASWWIPSGGAVSPAVGVTATTGTSQPAMPGSTPGGDPGPGQSPAPVPPTPGQPPAPGQPPVSNPTPRPIPKPTPAPPASFTGKIDGAVETMKYGPVQVRAVFTNGRLTDVVALRTPTGDSHSVAIATRSVPILRSEALAAQSASIHTVSGATYTSKAYAASLQSALDKKP
jgi:uncharacterized protein with FMN-binding domain